MRSETQIFTTNLSRKKVYRALFLYFLLLKANGRKGMSRYVNKREYSDRLFTKIIQHFSICISFIRFFLLPTPSALSPSTRVFSLQGNCTNYFRSSFKCRLLVYFHRKCERFQFCYFISFQKKKKFSGVAVDNVWTNIKK